MNKLLKVNQLVFVLIVVAAFAGGSNPALAKYALESLGPFTTLSIRFGTAGLFLLPFVINANEVSSFRFKQLFTTNLVGAINPILLFIALQFTQASFSPLIYAGVPAMTALYVALVKKEKIQSKQLLGILLGFLGVALIILLPLFQTGGITVSVLGNGMIVLASLFFLAYGLMSKNKQHHYGISPLALTFYFCVTSLVVTIPFTLYEVMVIGLSTPVGPGHLISATLAGILGTGIFYLSYQFAIKHSTAITASLFTFLQPLFGISLAAVLLGEQITPLFVVGGILAVAGAWLASPHTKVEKN